MSLERLGRVSLTSLFCLTKVWASKWNERAYFSTRKVKLDHDFLCMAVLVQEIISADYAFVIHTTNPSSGDSSEIYAEVCTQIKVHAPKSRVPHLIILLIKVVQGLGETLVGAYPGRALSFVCNKNNLDSPKVHTYITGMKVHSSAFPFNIYWRH